MDGAVMSGHDFIPDAAHQRDFRAALGQFATGVTIVTTQTVDGPLGITANSFASLSLDPPLVMWAPGKFSRRFQAFAEAERFVIHILAADQLPLAQHFARDGRDFDIPDLDFGAGDVPLLPGCLVRFHCTGHAVHPGGDHAIVVGAVARVTSRPGAALTFYQGDYGQIG